MSTSNQPNPALQQIEEKAKNFVTNEGRQRAMSFVPRPSDVIVVTPSKCGTTWMQQIMHQLRSGGDMSFTDIDDVVPWIELAYDVGQNLDAEQKFQPRCFKTHEWFGCPEGSKYIFVYREPCATFYSAFNFVQGYSFQPGEITLDEFVKHTFLSTSDKMGENYFDQLLNWWPKRNDPNVLFLLYEDMLEDLESAVSAVASFMGIDDEARKRNAVKMSSFDFMKQNGDKFAGHRVSRRNKAVHVPEDHRLKRVNTGSATKGREMMDECTKQAVQKMWSEIVTKKLDFQDYNAFREALKKERQS